jgi:hypothetical protein
MEKTLPMSLANPLKICLLVACQDSTLLRLDFELSNYTGRRNPNGDFVPLRVDNGEKPSVRLGSGLESFAANYLKADLRLPGHGTAGG